MYNIYNISLKQKFQDWKLKNQNWIKNFPQYNNIILIYNDFPKLNKKLFWI